MSTTLTVESAAGVSAFIQELTTKALGGEPVDEETVALRMLAAEHSAPDDDLSVIHSLSTNGPATRSSSGDDKFAQLAALMMGDVKPPNEQVADGQVPKPAPVVILPSYDVSSIQSNYDTLMDANSMIQLYSNLMQVQLKPEGFNINTEAGAAYNFQAKQAFDAMMGPLAGFFVFENGATQQVNQNIARDQVHSKFLGAVFDNFGFDDDTKASLDGQLTTFVAGIANLAPKDQGSIDFSLRIGLCPQKNITGSSKNPIYVYQPTIFLVKMSFTAESFYQSTGKNSGNNMVKLNFGLTVTKCALNAKRFEANRAKFDQIFQLVTNSNLQAYSKLLNKQVKTKEANPGSNVKID